MIIKSMSRKAPTFGQLIDYISRNSDPQTGTVFARNLYQSGHDAQVVAGQFLDNYCYLPKRANGNALYHEVIVLEEQDHLSADVIDDALHVLAERYCELRAPHQMVWGRVHRDTGFPHIHLMISANGRGAGQSASDPFWEQAAEKLIRIMAQCLNNQPDPALRNLANLRHLVAGFDAHIAPKGQLGKIDQFVLSATQSDPVTFSAYQAFVHGNLKTIQSILMTADVALDPIATPEMATLTATNSIDFDELRQRPTALFIMVNQTQMDLYAFLLNLFYADLFKSLLKDHQNSGRPVWLFLDEFGHLKIPGFEVFATTARKYKISYALFLQSLAQLEGRYGRHNARTIVEGLGTECYLPGTSLDTARELEARLGRIDKAPLMAVNDIIRMKENEALMLYSNRLPVLLKTKRYYQRGDLRRRSKRAVAPLPQKPSVQPRLIQL